MVSLSVVVATRNRPEALKMCLPLLVSQTHPPKEIIVIDSSDNPHPNRALVERLSINTKIFFQYIESPQGLPLQRNIGLRHATGDVIVFPDDDSLLFDNALMEFAKVYEADDEGKVIGVALSPTDKNPLNIEKAGGAIVDLPYQGKNRKSIKNKVKMILYHYLKQVAPPPYVSLGRSLISGYELPPKLVAMGCRLRPDQEGYRMSFRASAIRSKPFNETLTEYALGEDRDACYGLLEQGIIVESPARLVHHYQHPGARHGGFRHGVVEGLNIAYIVCRHSQPGDVARREILPWLNYRKMVIATVNSMSRYHRERLRGLIAARRELPAIFAASHEQLDEVYSNAMGKLLPD